MTTYTQENKKYLNSVPTSNLKSMFLKHVALENIVSDLLDELSETKRRKFMIKILSNEQDFMLSELEQWTTEC